MLELLDPLALARAEQLIADAAPRLHQSRDGQIVELHHQAWGEIHEGHAPVGLERQHSADAKARSAELDRVARTDLERRHHSLIQPYGAPRRNRLDLRVCGIEGGGDAQLAAQRVARRG